MLMPRRCKCVRLRLSPACVNRILTQGERLSHAVGCAFAICLEKKQKREKDSVSVTYNENSTSFTRLGSFRQVTLTERLADPQSAIIPGCSSSRSRSSSSSSSSSQVDR